MTDANTLKVKILDKDYLVGCPPEQQASLQSAADHLDEKMREIRASGKILGIERIAVMAALNITYELLESSKGSQDSSQMLKSLEEKMNQVLKNA